MKRKISCIFLLTGIMLSVLLSGCGGKTDDSGSGQGATDGSRKVTVALWGDQLTEHYGEYLQETFPDVEFEFYVATNSTDFYRFKEKNGELPDILTVRRFSLNDVATWKDSLMDLSDTELANSFHQSYLRSYTYSDGTVNWLPACAEIDGILINKNLLEANNLSVPTNYQEFVDTCDALKELGICPFRSNFGADYTCMEILQGLSISQLISQKGREWRQQYESGQTDQLNEEVWLPAFERMQQFIEYAKITPDTLKSDTADVFQAYRNHEVAMIRCTSDEAYKYGAGEGSMLAPYFGEREEDNWYLTYPSFQVAANVKAEEDPARKQLILDILGAMLSEEGLRHITSGQNMIAYNKDVTLEFSPMLDSIGPCIDDNRLYIRLASADMFSVSQKVVQEMIRGGYADARSAYDAFNKEMQANGEEAPVVTHIDTDYAYAFDPDGGSPAASAVMNSLREELGVPLLIGQSVNVAGNICAGDYTEEELRFLTMGEGIEILRCEMTGQQLYDYINYILSISDRQGVVFNDSTLYVSSGFEMEIHKTDGKYVLEKLTIDGQELNKAQTYSVAILGNEVVTLKSALASVGVLEYDKEEKAYKQIIVDRLMTEGKQLVQPTAYISLK